MGICSALVVALVGIGSAGAVEPRSFVWPFPIGQAPLADVLRELSQQTNLRVDASRIRPEASFTTPFQRETFWNALEIIAAQTGHRIELREGGESIALIPSDVRPPLSIDGPFRFVASEVLARRDLQTGRTAYDLSLGVNWEPRLKVIRMDAYPRIREAIDDQGQRLTVPAIETKVPVTGYQATSTIGLDGLTRESRAIAIVAGEFTITFAERMLVFRFDDLTALPAEFAQEGVRLILQKPEKVNNRWFVNVKVTYPPDQPEFESFESWLHGNRITLIAPGGEQEFSTDDYSLTDQGRTVLGSYVFTEDAESGLTPGDWKGWSLRYETPSVLREEVVPFRLSEIALP